MISEKNGEKMLWAYFRELSDESVNKIWFQFRYCINSVYVQCKDSFFKVSCEKIGKSGDIQEGITNK